LLHQVAREMPGTNGTGQKERPGRVNFQQNKKEQKKGQTRGLSASEVIIGRLGTFKSRIRGGNPRGGF